MKLNQEQLISFNHRTKGFVMGNKYLRRALSEYSKLIVMGESNQLFFTFDHLTEQYQQKFILNNFELYCTSLFLALKPTIITFLKNEGMTGYSFNCVFLVGKTRIDRIEMVSVK